MKILKHGWWWQVKDVFPFYESLELRSAIRGKVKPNLAQGKRDQAQKRYFITDSSMYKHWFYDIDSVLRLHFANYIADSDQLRIELCCDAPGMWINPHYDIPEKSFTMQVYLGEINQSTVLLFGDDDIPLTVPWHHNGGYAIVRDHPVKHCLPKVARSMRHSILINYVDQSWIDTSQILHVPV
jgi:hypothetical protein